MKIMCQYDLSEKNNKHLHNSNASYMGDCVEKENSQERWWSHIQKDRTEQ